MSANVGSDTGMSNVVETVVTAVGIASPSLSVHKLFPLPVFIAVILSFRRWTMSADVGSDTGMSGVVETVVTAVGIASPSLSVQKLFPVPVCIAAILSSRRRTTSSHVGRYRMKSAVTQTLRAWSKMW